MYRVYQSFESFGDSDEHLCATMEEAEIVAEEMVQELAEYLLQEVGEISPIDTGWANEMDAWNYVYDTMFRAEAERLEDEGREDELDDLEYERPSMALTPEWAEYLAREAIVIEETD